MNDDVQKLMEQAAPISMMRGTEGGMDYAVLMKAPISDDLVLGVKLLAAQHIHEKSDLTLMTLICRIRVGWIDWHLAWDQNEHELIPPFEEVGEVLDMELFPMNFNAVRGSIHMQMQEWMRRETIEERIETMMGEGGWFLNSVLPAIQQMGNNAGMVPAGVEVDQLTVFLTERLIAQVAENKVDG